MINSFYLPALNRIVRADDVNSYSKILIIGIESIEVNAALVNEDGLEALLITTRKAFIENIPHWPETNGYSVRIDENTELSDGYVRICLEVNSGANSDLFIVLAEDICRELSAALNEFEATKILHQRLLQWQEFLRKYAALSLSKNQQLGLFGELVVMYKILIPILGGEHVVDRWRGCYKAAQDYQFEEFALEVKATRAITPTTVGISNLLQLDDSVVKTIILSLVEIDESESSGKSLVDVVGLIREGLTGAALVKFDQGLFEVGYIDVLSHEYERTLYKCRDFKYFLVEGDFPRLTRASIPYGVKDVKYKISVDACLPYSIDEDLVQQMLAKIED